ncbi:MAG: chromate transporter [Eubacteriales bacterium]
MIAALNVFWMFFKIGLCTFGGGYAMVELVADQVISMGWMEMREIIDFVAISESTPGPIAINMATYVGFRVAGPLGACLATFGVVLPSFIIIMLVAKYYAKFIANRFVAGAMRGLRPAAAALIAAAGVSIAAEVFFPNALSVSALISFDGICGLATLALCVFLAVKKAKPYMILLASAAMGLGWGCLGALIA